MEGVFIISAIISLVISYFIIYSAVKNALSDELKKTNELLEKVLKQNNQEHQSEIDSKIYNIKDDLVDSKIDLSNEVYPKTKKIFKYYTDDAKTLLIFSNLNTGHTYGDLAFIGDKPAKDGKYKIGKSSFICIENGKVVENNLPSDKNVMQYYTLGGSHLHIYTDLKSGYEIGDLAFIGDKPAKDGKYKLSVFDSIVVENGKVVK